MNDTFAIQQVAVETGLSIHTLRYYEQVGLLSAVERAANGHRRYSQDDIEWLGFLKCLRSTGMPIAEMQKFTELVERGEDSVPGRRQLLEAHRTKVLARLQELQEMLHILEGKISHYQNVENSM
ncbi:MAG: MerR family transcriptional regulator [Chloroflexota bacterium]